MPGALVGAVSCGRCGGPDVGAPACAVCGAPWVEAASGSVGPAEAGPLLGVVRAGTTARLLALLVDLLPVAALVVLLVLVDGAAGLRPLLGAAVVLVLLAQAGLLLTRGRSLGRYLLGQRTVDDLTGQPVRWRRLGSTVGSGRLRRRVTADLRRGADPADPVPAPSPGRRVRPAPGTASEAGDLAAAHLPAASPADPGPGSPARSVSIALENGERYEIFSSLLLGRSPSDPTGQSGRALLAWPDLSRRLAKTHALLEWSGTVLWVTDLHTVSGTTLISPDGQRRPLPPGVRVPAGMGSSLECGGRLLQVVPHA